KPRNTDDSRAGTAKTISSASHPLRLRMCSIRLVMVCSRIRARCGWTGERDYGSPLSPGEAGAEPAEHPRPGIRGGVAGKGLPVVAIEPVTRVRVPEDLGRDRRPGRLIPEGLPLPHGDRVVLVPPQADPRGRGGRGRIRESREPEAALGDTATVEGDGRTEFEFGGHDEGDRPAHAEADGGAAVGRHPLMPEIAERGRDVAHDFRRAQAAHQRLRAGELVVTEDGRTLPVKQGRRNGK